MGCTTVLPSDQTGLITCPSLLGARTWSGALPVSYPLSCLSALRHDQNNRRPSDRLQLFFWNPGPVLGSDPSLLASHLNGPWHVVCVQEGSGCCNHQSLAENFHVVTQHGCAVLLNKDTFEPNYSCLPLFIPCKLRYASWAVEGMGVTGNFRSAPDKWCSYFTVATLHLVESLQLLTKPLTMWPARAEPCILGGFLSV